jgi:hypothetical protein
MTLLRRGGRHPFSPHRWNGLIISQFRVQLDIHWTSQLRFGHGNWVLSQVRVIFHRLLPRTEIADDAVTFDAHEARSTSSA